MRKIINKLLEIFEKFIISVLKLIGKVVLFLEINYLFVVFTLAIVLLLVILEYT